MLLSASPTAHLDDLLDRVGVKLQLSPTAYDLAVERYRAIADCLRAKGSPLAKYELDIYPQGSLNIGTTVKLRGRKEFDLDFVCEFRVDPSVFPNPIKLLDMIEETLRAHGTYRHMVERKNRCIRVTYANEFYMDILPACPSPSVCLHGEHCVVVPDCEADDWKASNPKGYALWYKNRATEAVVKFRKSVEPVPEQQAYEDLATLNRVVQLLKRHRDIAFEKAAKGTAPISIVLTTLAAQNYSGHTSVFEAMGAVLDGIILMIPDVARGRLKVLNPTNPGEDFSEQWDGAPEAYLAFVSWVRDLKSKWEGLTGLSGLPAIKAALEKMFGERVAKEVMEEHVKAYDEARRSGALGVGRGTGLIVTATTVSATAIPRNTFYGGAGKYFRAQPKRLGMPQQHQRVSARHPQFKLLALRPHLVEWQGVVQPSPLSDAYTVRVRYEKYKGPRIIVVSPALRLREGAVSIPHTYVGNRLCLYYPDYGEWTSDKYIADTIVPWISLWLLYYEAWLATGEWLGGGIEHGGEGKTQV